MRFPVRRSSNPKKHKKPSLESTAKSIHKAGKGKLGRKAPPKKEKPEPIKAEEFAEEVRLVASETPESVYFQKMMEGLIQKLFPKIDLARKPIHFRIFDEKVLNAFFTVALKTPIIAFSKGLLLQVKFSEDIAGILGHEFTHKQFSDAYGAEHRNSKLEELGADAWPLVLIAEAGMDPRQYVDFAKTHFLDGKKASVLEIVDVHPTQSSRVRALDDGLAVLDKRMGGFMDRIPTPLPPDFKEVIEKARHYSYVDLALAGYEGLGSVQKIQFLESLVRQTPHWNPRRITDLDAIVRTLKIKRSIPEERQAQDSFGDTLLQIAAEAGTKVGSIESGANALKFELVERVYQTLAGLTSMEGIQPIGRLKLYEEQIDAFMEAEKPSEALDAAIRFLDLINQEPVELAFLGSLVTWPIFKVPSIRASLKRKKTVPWNRHVDWAARDLSGRITRVLLALGVIDQRLFITTGAELESEYTDGILPVLLQPLMVEDEEANLLESTRSNIANFEIDDDGYLIPEERIKKRKVSASEEITQGKDIDFQFKQIEKAFLEVLPGDKKAEEDLIRLKDSLTGDRSSSNIKKRHIFWIALQNAERNFKLFLDLNADLFRELSPTSGEEDLAIPFVGKLRKMADSGDPKQISYVRGLYLGFPEGSPTYEYSFQRQFISGFLLPIFEGASRLIILIIDNPGKIFSRREQELLLDEMLDVEESCKKFDVKNPDYEKLDVFRSFIGYKAPINGKSYIKLLEYFQGILPTSKKSKPGSVGWYRESEVKTNTFSGGLDTEVITGMLIIELRLLVYQRRMAGFDFDRFIPVMGKLHPENYRDLKKYFRPQVQKKTWPADSQLLIDQWIKLYHADLFPSDQILCYRILKQVLGDISQMDTETQSSLYEKLLFGQRLKDPRVRGKIERLWIKALYVLLGRDDGSKTYSEQVQTILDRMRVGLNLNDRILLAAKLADRLQTQERLTRQFSNMLKAMTKTELEGSYLKGALLEGALLTLKKSDQGRKGLIEYLINPMTNNSISEFHFLLEDLAHQSLTVTEVSSRSADVKQFKIPRKRVRAEIKFLWVNFWSSPFGIRAVLFEHLLFPEIASEEINRSIFDYVNDKLFPLNEPYAKEARYFVDAYFAVVPKYQHKILLSAMMVTAEKSNEEQLSIGQRLAIVLELLGPAETKLGQVIHSHPKTPEEIRQGMGRLKSQADPPFRWDLLDNYKASVPANIRNSVSRIGRLLGSASFYLALEADMKDGTAGVFKILRPHALKRANNGFQIMLQMLAVLHKTFDSSTLETLGQMIAQAQKNAQLETDFEISSQQAAIAVTLYDNRQIILNGETYSLHIPKIIHYGQTYQFMERAPGKHFNDLPEETLEELAYKKGLATVYLAFELALILSGSRFDSDRHGAQCRIVDRDIHLFDWGGMALVAPSSGEKHQLGDTFFDVLLAIQSGNPLDEAFINAVQGRADAGENVEYLLSVQKALLSLEDFRHYLTLPELMGILGVLMNRAIDPEIANAFFQKAFTMGLTMEQLQETLNQSGGLDITIRRCR